MDRAKVKTPSTMTGSQFGQDRDSADETGNQSAELVLNDAAEFDLLKTPLNLKHLTSIHPSISQTIIA